jgi:uncharacterized protein (UPF0332 family)
MGSDACIQRETGLVPVPSPNDQVMLFITNCSAAQLATLSNGGRQQYPFPVATMVRQAISDRLSLAGEHLRVGDQLLFGSQFRSSISRHYYAMYHSARAIVFAETMGDDHQRHNVLPRHLPSAMSNAVQRGAELTSARLLRNEADYDPYPANQPDWESDARQLAVTSADFVQACEDFALTNGHI